jgi:hypothetical protein
MANRLRPVIRDIICLEQSAFIIRHMITDNALVTFSYAKKSCAYKLDLGCVRFRLERSKNFRVFPHSKESQSY